MGSRKALTVLLAVVALILFVDVAQAYYTPGLGRFISRDPIMELGFEMSVNVGAPTLALYLPDDPEYVQELGGSNRYAYVYNNPANKIDAFGLCASPPAGVRINPPMEQDCCACLVYSESGGHPGCTQAYLAVMQNRINSNWPVFKNQKGYCAMAATGPASGKTDWAGGEGSNRYNNCATCMNNATNPKCDDCCPLSNKEAEAALAAGEACAKQRRGEGGADPTGGAQFVNVSKQGVIAAVGAHNVPRPCTVFQIPGCPSWFAKCSRQPLAK